MVTFEVGRLGDLPCVTFGRGDRPLVMFPGINDGLYDATTAPRWTAWFYGHFAARYRVFVVSRRRGLPDGYGTREMARDYAEAMATTVGRADVIGLSMGSFIAQHLAADFPGWVSRLVLSLAPHRSHEVTLSILERWIALAESRRWPELYADLARMVYTGVRAGVLETTLPLLLRLGILPAPADPRDFVVSARACMAHDASGRLSAIQTPTLVLAAARDKLFPVVLFREMTLRIPDATLAVIGNTGHGVFQERKRLFDERIQAFLAA